jgi:hypothetical protein
VVDQDIVSKVGQFLLGCKILVSRGVVVQEQGTLCELSVVIFLQNVLQLHQKRLVILRIDSLALWMSINEEDAILIPRNGGEVFSGFYTLKFLWWAEPLRRQSVDCFSVSGLLDTA